MATTTKKRKPKSAPELPGAQPMVPEVQGVPRNYLGDALATLPGARPTGPEPQPMPRIDLEAALGAMFGQPDFAGHPTGGMPTAGMPSLPMAPQQPASGLAPPPMSPSLMNSLDALAKAAALRRDMGAIQQNGLPGYFTPQEATDYGMAPGAYQFNMPSPAAPPAPPSDPRLAMLAALQGQPTPGNADMLAGRATNLPQNADPMANLPHSLQNGMRDKFSRLAQLPPDPALQRNPNLSLTPQQFMQQLNQRQSDADIAATLAAAGPNTDLAEEAHRAAKNVRPTRAADVTYREVAASRGALPTGADVAQNLANREQELLQRQKNVENRGLVRGKSKELGIPRAVAGAMMGLDHNGQTPATPGGQAAASSIPQTFAHYYAMTGDAKTAAQLTEMHHKPQGANALGEQLLAFSGQVQDPTLAKQAFKMWQDKFMPGGGAAAAPTLPGTDPAKTKLELDNAIFDNPENPRKASDQLAANAGISRPEADALIKQHHPRGKVFDRAAAKKAQRNAMNDMSVPSLLQPVAGALMPWFDPSMEHFSQGIPSPPLGGQ